MADRRPHAYVDRSGQIPEALFRQQVDDAFQRLARLIAANTTADGALANRVTDLEDAPGGAYTDEQARDAIGAALVAGTGISITVSDVADTITIDNTGTVTDEHIQDVVGAMVNAGTGISVSYNDLAGTETITCTITQYTDEQARDALGAALVGGTNITITPNDGTDTITIDGPSNATIDERAQDAVASMWVDGHAIDSTYVDGAPSFTVAVDETEFATGPGLITPAMLNNGTAASVLGRSANSSGARADIASARSGDVCLRNASDVIVFDKLIADSFATGPGIVPPAALDNGSARSVLGRSSGTAGARADIASSADGQFLQRVSGALVWQPIAASDLGGVGTRFVARMTPVLTINTTSAATSLLGGVIAIPANTLTANGQQLRLNLHGNVLSNAAVGQTWIITLSLNGVTLIQDTTAAITQSATRRPFRYDVLITRIDSTHATASLLFHLSPVAGATTGLGDLASAGSDFVTGSSNTSVAGMDFTASQNLDLTSQASSNSVNMETVVQGGSIEAI